MWGRHIHSRITALQRVSDESYSRLGVCRWLIINVIFGLSPEDPVLINHSNNLF
jgi:hypothetical protein